MKTFKFDIILTEEDLCNRKKEVERLSSVMKRGGRLVLYSLRRMGKTSLVSVVSKKLEARHPNQFHLFVDLNEVGSLSDVAARFRSHFELALRERFPIHNVRTFLGDLLSRIKVGLPGGADVSLERFATERPEEYLMSLFGKLQEMSVDRSLVLIVDEFQGVADQKDAQAILRKEFQKLSQAAVILMGSNQRLLYRIFNDKKLPFFGFGEDMELGAIPTEDYLPYMNERFAPRNLHISRETAIHLMHRMNDIPNYINELGAWIVDTCSNAELTNEQIDLAIEAAARSKRGRYISALYGYTANQKTFIKAIAHLGRVENATGKEMREHSGLSATELSRAKADLEDCPLLTWDTENRIFIIDPFLRRFLEIM